MSDLLKQIMEASEALKKESPEGPFWENVKVMKNDMLPSSWIMLSPDLWEVFKKAFPDKEKA